ncbi:MAG: UDP-glucose dehydrogenase family protein [Hyphomicrobium sp.]
MKIAMIGTGYVGLVSGACFSDFGFDVACVDKAAHKIDSLRAGRMPLYQPGLSELVAKNVNAKRLSFTTDLARAVRNAEVVFIAVGTPTRPSDGHADLSYVMAAAREIAEQVDGYKVVVIKSTVPVGTGDAVEAIISETLSSDQFSVVSNPEFLREGAAIDDFKRPDRVVVGVGMNDDRARAVMERVYRPLSINQAPVYFTDRRSSELIKYASNAFLATKISFINEIANLCEKAGANVQDVARGMGLDRRIGPKFLHAGPGFGGSCFPKDTLALIKTGQAFESPMRIVEAVATVNVDRKRAMVDKVVSACGGSVQGKLIAVLGLTFKPNTDDMRDAPSIGIIKALQDAGAAIRAYDPAGMDNAREVIDDLTYAEDAYACLDGADALVLVTEWDVFRALDIGEMKRRLKTPAFIDLRNVYRPDEVRSHGFDYVSVGR